MENTYYLEGIVKIVPLKIMPTNRIKFDQRTSKCVFISFKRGKKYMFCWIFNPEKFLCVGMLYFMNIFFHIKRLRILVIKLTVLTFFIKILLSKTNLFWVNLHKPFLYPLHAPCDNVENKVIITMNQTLRFQKKFAPRVTKTSMKLMKQHSQFEWVPEQKDHLNI